VQNISLCQAGRNDLQLAELLQVTKPHSMECSRFFAQSFAQATPGLHRSKCNSEPNKCLDFRAHLTHFANKADVMSELIAYVDGGSHGNPGPAGIGVMIEAPNGERIRIAKWIGHHDNNVAEYTALLEALQYALELKAKALHVFSDSEVVVRQMKGEYACRSPRLYSLNWVCQKLARSLQFSIAHIRRQDNAEANRLANSAVRKRFAAIKSK